MAMRFNPRKVIETHFGETIRVKEFTMEACITQISDASILISECLSNKGKLLLCGNGGSAADCQHFAAELMSRYRQNRRALAAVALTTDTSFLTAHANDLSFLEVFERQVEGLGQAGDILIAFSTSGRSMNVLKAMQMANDKLMKVIGFTGNNGFTPGVRVDVEISIPTYTTALIQEAHQSCYHVICELVDKLLFDT